MKADIKKDAGLLLIKFSIKAIIQIRKES